MMQTKIDQFFKVTSNSKKDNVKESSGIKSPIIGKTRGKQIADKSRTSFVHKNDKCSSYKMSERQRGLQDNISLDGEVSNCHTHLSNTDTYNSPIKINGTKNRMLSTKQASPIRSQQYTPSTHNNTKFTSKTLSSTKNTLGTQERSSGSAKFTPKTSSPIKNALDRSPKSAKIARRRLFIKDKTEELLSTTIINLNLAKEGVIANNDINLEKVYSSGKFNYKYNPIDLTVTTRYEIDDVVVPKNMYSLHFFQAIVTVFSNQVNCGYFDQDELDLIFSLITLRTSAQELFVRMLKRKHTWHRISNIKYNEISNDLKPIFDELVSRSIFKSNTEEEDMSVLLNLLQVDEIRKLCQESKINFSGKTKSIKSLLKFCNKTKSLFPGMMTPTAKLRASINRSLGDCVLLNTRVKEVVDRIITLLIPNRDPTETLVDVFLILFRVEKEEIKFPKITISDLPIFVSKGHLLHYIEAKNTLTDVLNAIEKKQWETVRYLGTLAAQRLPLFLERKVDEVELKSFQDSNLPHHIRHFMPGYMWLKVLCKSIDAFKKTKETIPEAIKFLRMLIDQDCHMKHRKGQWYSELIKIEMYHRKDLEASIILLSDAMICESLTEVDRLDLLDRAKMIGKRKSGISESAKVAVKHMLDNMSSRTHPICQNSITIKGTLSSNASQRKSSWCISNGVDQQTYGSVESLALYDYKHKGYFKGVHCEGAFPITLFAILFWDEIYDMNIPGVWVSLYQDAPLDLYSSDFYKNRKEKIDMKLQILREWNSETLSKHLKHKFELHCEYKSICQSNIFDDSNSFEEVAFCLGVEGIIGICERLIYNFPLWKAGFPDLIVWNAYTKEYKIVEVKGPGDTLSTKQRLWLDYLNRLGLNTEVCYCESNTSHSKGRKRKHEESMT